MPSFVHIFTLYVYEYFARWLWLHFPQPTKARRSKIKYNSEVHVVRWNMCNISSLLVKIELESYANCSTYNSTINTEVRTNSDVIRRDNIECMWHALRRAWRGISRDQKPGSFQGLGRSRWLRIHGPGPNLHISHSPTYIYISFNY